MVPLTEVEKKWVKVLSKAYPAYSHHKIAKLARKRAANQGDPAGYPSNGDTTTKAEEMVRNSIGPAEKIAIGAGWWALRRLWRREIMPELVKQESAVPSRKVRAVAGGGIVASLIVLIGVKLFGVEIGGEEAALLATAVATLAGYFFRERAPKVHVPE